MMQTMNTRMIKTPKRPGPRPMFDDGEPKAWEPPQTISRGTPCKCGAPMSSMRVYGTAKDAAGNVLRVYARCTACGTKHAVQ